MESCCQSIKLLFPLPEPKSNPHACIHKQKQKKKEVSQSPRMRDGIQKLIRRALHNGSAVNGSHRGNKETREGILRVNRPIVSIASNNEKLYTLNLIED